MLVFNQLNDQVTAFNMVLLMPRSKYKILAGKVKSVLGDNALHDGLERMAHVSTPHFPFLRFLCLPTCDSHGK